jgi:hypothetical protein
MSMLPPEMPPVSSPASPAGGNVEMQLISLIKQAKKLADQNRIDFTLILEKALGGVSAKPTSAIPPAPSLAGQG